MIRVNLFASILFLLFLMTGCAPKPQSLSLGKHAVAPVFPAEYDALPGWQEDDADEALAVFRQGCQSSKRADNLALVCEKAMEATEARQFFETYFAPYRLSSGSGESTGLMTGYYEPMLYGAREKSERYRYPLYTKPDDLVTVDLSSLYPELRRKKLRGRLVGDRLVPYASRSQINAGRIDAPVICYVDDIVDRFFLQVQGSGRVQLENNETIFVGYADENGHPYESIGRELIRRNEATLDEMSLQFIRSWLHENPEKATALLDHNPSYIFFGERSQGATGSLGVELTPMRSIAVDRRYIPLGMPVFYAADDPETGAALNRLAFAQDTGGAIKGEVRADLFWGHGKSAEHKAGLMKSPLKMWVLVPKAVLNPDSGRIRP